MENNQIAVIESTTQPMQWTPQQIETIKKTVAVGANNDELNMFLSIAGTYNLNPFLKEIWCIKMGGKAGITTSRDGYLKIANRDSHYRGMVSDVVYSNDKFMKTKDGVEHSYTAERGRIIGAYACVYRDDRDYPAYFFAPMSDYDKKDGTWKTYPHAMIQKVAESMALKRAFSISGLVTEEEIGTSQEQRARPQEQQQPASDTLSSKERDIQLAQIYQRYMAVCGNQKNHAINAMKAVTGKEHSADFTNDDLKALFADVIRREDEQMRQEMNAEAEFDAEG